MPHHDVAAVGEALAAAGDTRAMVLVESVYSVLGDEAPLAALAAVCERYDALLVVDEAHGLGVRGPGLVRELGLAGLPHVLVTATLSKALGSQGGAVLGPQAVVDHLVNRARPFVFDTGLAPAAAGAALEALRQLRARPELSDVVRRRIREAGVDAYNHNINTAESHHDQIVQTHTYADRVDTVEKVKTAGLSPCSGLIAGLGETDEQLVEALFALRELDSDSIPVNFLMPFDGTPLENTWELTPLRCVKILAMARFVCPDREIRIAGGREMHLRTLQGLALNVANSIFLGDYLTSEGQAAEADLDLIRDHGFTVLGAPDAERTDAPAAVAHDPAKRRRGAGTAVAPNA